MMAIISKWTSIGFSTKGWWHWQVEGTDWGGECEGAGARNWKNCNWTDGSTVKILKFKHAFFLIFMGVSYIKNMGVSWNSGTSIAGGFINVWKNHEKPMKYGFGATPILGHLHMGSAVWISHWLVEYLNCRQHTSTSPCRLVQVGTDLGKIRGCD